MDNLKKAASLLFGLALAASLAPSAALASNGPAGRARTAANELGDGLAVSKVLGEPDENGVRMETLEAYAEGSMSVVTKSVPADIVLVLDQSGSMSDPFGTESGSYEDVLGRTNDWLYRSAAGVGFDEPNLYVGKGDGTYAPVSVERRWNRNARQYEYTYTWEGQDAPFVSSGSNAAPNLPAGAALYVYRSGGSISRAEALKTAAHGFVDAVKKNAVGADGVAGTDDDVAHRVAVVGFANGSIQDDWAFSGDSYHNTGLFDGGSLTLYNNIGADQYASALKDMSADEGSANVKASIDALQADGGTYIDYGLAMAQSVFDGAFVAQGEERDRVVVVLTDGSPGTRGSDEGVANRAIAAAAGLKGSGATVYSVGIFPNAIASGSLPVYSRSWNDDMSNRFMHLLSSNYPSAASMTSSGDRFVDVEGAMPDFYFAASDAAGLEAVFRAIAQESGGSSIQLDDEAFVKDVMAPGFALAPGTDASGIEVFTQAYRGDGPDGNPVWGEPTPLTDPGIVVESSTVTVSGFDYAGNWVGKVNAGTSEETVHGSKLVVRIPVVRTATFGGTGYANAVETGVYLDEDTKVKEFPRPVDGVPIAYQAAASDDAVWLGEEAQLADNLEWSDGFQPNGKNNALVNIDYTLEVDGRTYVCSVPAGTDTTAAGYASSWTLDGQSVDAISVLPLVAGSAEYRFACTVSDAWTGDNPQPSLGVSAPFTVEAKACSITFAKKLEAGSASFESGDSFLFSLVQDEGTIERYRRLAETYPGAETLLTGDVRFVLQKDGTAVVTGLPVGGYAALEDARWSWRYELTGGSVTADGEQVGEGIASGSGSAGLLVSLPAELPSSGSMTGDVLVTFANKLVDGGWLSHETRATNLFDVVDGVVEVTSEG